MKHISHEHELVLNENYIAREGDICRGCGEEIFSSKSFVYSCSSVTGDVNDASCAGFLLHKSCAELPPEIEKPTNPDELLVLCYQYSHVKYVYGQYYSSNIIHCDICHIRISWETKQFFYYSSDFCVCLKCYLLHTQQCLEDPKFNHPAHSQHPLSLIQQPSSFQCHACNSWDDNIKDMSYRCTKCQFWMHKSCADAPTPFQFHFHDKHPLILSFYLPEVYHKHVQYCRLCNKTLSLFVWLYCCFNCRFFTHFQCARTNQMLSSCVEKKYDSHVVQVPAADETSTNLLCEKFIKAMSILNYNHGSIISSINGIKHWTHEEHHLQLIDYNEYTNQKDDDILLLCDGCVKPIRSDQDDQFYSCVPCKYFLHKLCAEFPKEIKHSILSGYAFGNKYREPYKLFRCGTCGSWGNGIFFRLGSSEDFVDFHFECITYPEIIKHEAHPHKLRYVVPDVAYALEACKACGMFLVGGNHECEQCDYNICTRCMMKASVVKHPWDRHPLRLIYEPGMTIDHAHDFNCEFCSEDIDTNFWFYHCSDCDLSFHLENLCFERSSYRQYSKVKFGASDIVIDQLHPHSLTFVLNKKVRPCENCHHNQLGEPVLECVKPCKVVFCFNCINELFESV